MSRLLMLSILLALGGCQTVCPIPDPPKVVKVTVEKFRPLPDWATRQLPEDKPKANTPEEGVRLSGARLETVRYANCRSLLLEKLDKGEPVSPKDCD